jgi:hypothetical protein
MNEWTLPECKCFIQNTLSCAPFISIHSFIHPVSLHSHGVCVEEHSSVSLHSDGWKEMQMLMPYPHFVRVKGLSPSMLMNGAQENFFQIWMDAFIHPSIHSSTKVCVEPAGRKCIGMN